MNDSVLIRDFRKSDLNDLLSLLPMCFTKEFEISGFDPNRVVRMVNRAFGRIGTIVQGSLRLFGREPVKFLVAEADGKVIGTTIVNNRGKSGYISSVMVHPDYRRRGIATRLVTNALDYTRERKKARAILHVDSANAFARNVYVKLGFKAFEQLSYFFKESNSVSTLENASGAKMREFHRNDLDQVYDLIRASEDPNSLRIFDFAKKDLKAPFWQRLFRFATQKKLIAILGDRIVGYAEVSYTTPKEAGRIASVCARSEDKSLGVEKLLIQAASREIIEAGINRIRIAVPMAKQELVGIVKNVGFRETLVMDAMVTEF